MNSLSRMNSLDVPAPTHLCFFRVHHIDYDHATLPTQTHTHSSFASLGLDRSEELLAAGSALGLEHRRRFGELDLERLHRGHLVARAALVEADTHNAPAQHLLVGQRAHCVSVGVAEQVAIGIGPVLDEPRAGLVGWVVPLVLALAALSWSWSWSWSWCYGVM